MATSEPSGIQLEQALAAQQALRVAANLPNETFPLPAFVGMISDEIEALRLSGISDQEIADLIRSSSAIEITAEEVGRFYASPEDRHGPQGEASGKPELPDPLGSGS